MKNTKRMIGVALMVAVCLGSAFADHKVNKKKKMTVMVEQDDNCAQGISVSNEAWGDRQLCTDYPQGAGDHFQKYVGSTVEVEAKWTFEGDPKTSLPLGIAKVFKVGREKVNDPCAVSKLGLIAGIAAAASGVDAQTAASMAVNPACAATAQADGGDDGDQQ
jgi:hypothetical protein